MLGTAGGTTPMPGLGDDPLLAAGSGLLAAARASPRGETTCASFLWPRGDRHAPDGHVRVTVLSAPGDVLALWSGVVVLSPAGDLLGLTPRELEVMGLLVTGRTNAEMAEALVVAPRTVAAHVEHILHKLGVPSRTLAAVRGRRRRWSWSWLRRPAVVAPTVTAARPSAAATALSRFAGHRPHEGGSSCAQAGSS